MLSKEDMDLSAPLIWIHDYHLMLAANTIRQVKLNNVYENYIHHYILMFNEKKYSSW